MPVYETAAERGAAERAYLIADAKKRACLATGKPCQCTGNHHNSEMHRRGLHLRAENRMFHSSPRHVALHGCRWCGADEYGHCGGFRVQSKNSGPHTYEPPTPAQLRSRCTARGLDPDNPPPPPAKPEPAEPECRCDRGDEDAEPCDADDCEITFRMEVGFPG